jgi:hypothetical protein
MPAYRKPGSLPDAHVRRVIDITGELTSDVNDRLTLMTYALASLAKRCFVSKQTACDTLADIWEHIDREGNPL